MPAEEAPVSIDAIVYGEGIALVTVAGELDVETAPELHNRLADQVRGGRRHLLLDLSAVPFMDSSGINALLKAHDAASRAGGGVCLVSPAPAVQRILDLTGVSLAIPSVDDIDAAMVRVREGTARH
ncbi:MULTISPECIES: STAS domain-containing protein [unclassified Streptomyces]|uniref:STAS domain-containing protein n=1 Tax=unclassified Streptomyces TaxID=2593676 RepID=UPI0033B6144A